MWQTLSILGILMLVFGSYIGLENRKGLADKISDRETVEKNVQNLEKGISDSKAKFDDAEKARDEYDKDNTARLDEKKKLMTALEGLQSEIANMRASLKTEKTKLEKIEKDTAGLPDGEELKRKLDQLTSETGALESEKNDLEAQLAILNENRTRTSNSVEVFEEQEQSRRNRLSSKNLNAVISRSYQNFGFVILSAGYNGNVVPDSKLEVVRGDEVVGTLMVTTVEANQSAAQIDGASLAEGVVLRSGDRVRAVRPVVEPVTDPLPELDAEPDSELNSEPEVDDLLEGEDAADDGF